MTQKDNFELVIRSVHVIINLRSAKMPLQQSKIEQDKTDNPMVMMVTNLVTLDNSSKILQYSIARYLKWYYLELGEERECTSNYMNEKIQGKYAPRIIRCKMDTINKPGSAFN
jgi:hypothetical protein